MLKNYDFVKAHNIFCNIKRIRQGKIYKTSFAFQKEEHFHDQRNFNEEIR